MPKTKKKNKKKHDKKNTSKKNAAPKGKPKSRGGKKGAPSAAPKVELWKRVQANVQVTVVDGWLQVDIDDGQRLRIQLPSSSGSSHLNGSGKGGDKNEGPVVFEDFHMETEFPIEERKIQREHGGHLLPWENAYPGAMNVVSSSIVNGGVWQQGTPASPGPGHYIRRVNVMPGMAPQNVWMPGQPV